MPPTGSLHRRVQEVRTALEKGEAANGNHRVQLNIVGVVHTEETCRACPLSASCYLGGQTITVHEAAKQRYACIIEKHLRFFYHNSCVLTFALYSKTLDDHGYWGYSASTSRALSWYIQALVELDLVPPGRAHTAVAFFRERKDTRSATDRTPLTVFQC